MVSLISNSVFSADIEISSGTWTEKGYAIKGGWKIVERNNNTFIVFDDAFKTKKGPDLKVYLSKQSIEDVKGDSVEQSSIKISPLQSS